MDSYILDELNFKTIDLPAPRSWPIIDSEGVDGFCVAIDVLGMEVDVVVPWSDVDALRAQYDEKKRERAGNDKTDWAYEAAPVLDRVLFEAGVRLFSSDVDADVLAALVHGLDCDVCRPGLAAYAQRFAR